VTDQPVSGTPAPPPRRGRPPGSGKGLAQKVRLKQQVHGANQSTQQIGSIKHGRRTPPAFPTSPQGTVVKLDKVPDVGDLTTLEDAAMAQARQRYMGNQAVFRDRLYARLPDVADRIVDFVLAPNKLLFDQKGRPYNMVADDTKSMTKEQAHLANMILLKTMQTMAPIDEDGKAVGPAGGTGPVKIIVNTINGYQASDDAAPAGAQGEPGAGGAPTNLGRMGQAKSVTSVVFDNGKEQTRQDVPVPAVDEPGQMTTFKVGGV